MSESLYGLAIALCLLAAFRLVDRPGPARAAALGAAIGLAALTRGEALMLIVLLAVPAVLLAAPGGGRAAIRPGARAALLAVAVGAFAAVLAPWTIRNWAAFDRPVPVSTNTGTLLAGANCPPAYAGPEIGSWHFACVRAPGGGNEAAEAARLRDDGLDYAREHRGRLPAVLAARVLRTWDAFRPRQGVRFARAEGRASWAQYLGLAAYCALLPLAVVGFLALRRRRPATVLLAAMPAMVTVTSLVGYGLTRFRVAAEVSIVVLAAVAIGLALDRRRSGRAEAAA